MNPSLPHRSSLYPTWRGVGLMVAGAPVSVLAAVLLGSGWWRLALPWIALVGCALALDALLADDSTFYGDLFPHAVQWHGELYLEDGLHRALRAALQQRNVIHVRVLDLDALSPVQAPAAQASLGPSTSAIPAQPPVPDPRRA